MSTIFFAQRSLPKQEKTVKIPCHVISRDVLGVVFKRSKLTYQLLGHGLIVTPSARWGDRHISARSAKGFALPLWCHSCRFGNGWEAVARLANCHTDMHNAAMFHLVETKQTKRTKWKKINHNQSKRDSSLTLCVASVDIFCSVNEQLQSFQTS